MIRKIFWALLGIFIVILLQSTLTNYISFFNVMPDIALCILIYISFGNGVMTGQLTGFASGLLIDVVTLAPLGFNALMRTIIGAISGLFNGLFFMDAVLMPVLFCALATVLKGLFILLAGTFFDYSFSALAFTDSRFWIEVVYNAVLGPFVFAFLNLFKSELVTENKKI